MKLEGKLAMKSTKYDWQKVLNEIHQVIDEYYADMAFVQVRTSSRAMTPPEYLAGKLVRAIQGVIDPNFNAAHSWETLYEKVRSHLESFETDPEACLEDAKKFGMETSEYVASCIFASVGPAIDFHSFAAFSVAYKKKVSDSAKAEPALR